MTRLVHFEIISKDVNRASNFRRNTGANVSTIDVPSVDEYIAKVKSNGGIVVTNKTGIPGVSLLAYNTEGNVFGIMEDNNAR